MIDIAYIDIPQRSRKYLKTNWPGSDMYSNDFQSWAMSLPVDAGTFTKYFFINQYRDIIPQKTYSFVYFGSISETYELLKPLKINVIEEEDELIFDIPELEVYVIGKNLNENIKELCEDLIDLYEELNIHADKNLGKDALKWKNSINSYIRKSK